MESPENVATPLTAATVAVPDSVPPPGFVPIATVTFPVNPVAVFPCPSWAVTWTAGVIAAPAVVLLGCPVNTSCVALPAVMLNAVDVGSVKPPLDATSVYPVPALSIESPENVAIALTHVSTPVTSTVRLPAFAPIATVTFPITPVSFPVLPFAFCCCPARPVPSTPPTSASSDLVLLGCPVNTSCVALPAVMLNAVDVGSVKPPLDATSVYPVPALSIESPENV